MLRAFIESLTDTGWTGAESMGAQQHPYLDPFTVRTAASSSISPAPSVVRLHHLHNALGHKTAFTASRPTYMPSGAANIICGVAVGGSGVECGIPVAEDPATGAPYIMPLTDTIGNAGAKAGGGASDSSQEIIRNLSALLVKQQNRDSLLKTYASLARSIT